MTIAVNLIGLFVLVFLGGVFFLGGVAVLFVHDYDYSERLRLGFFCVLVGVGLGWAVMTGFLNFPPVEFGQPPMITLAGRVVNPETGGWLNERLVLVYLKGSEVARMVTQTGKYDPSGRGVHDGLFVVNVPNNYELSLADLRNSAVSPPITFGVTDYPSYAYYHWFDSFSEGSQVDIPVTTKNIRYSVKVLSGNAADLPRELLSAGSTRLKEDGTIVTLSTVGPTDAYSDDSDSSTVESLSTDQTTENVILNKLTVPINNCGGSGRVTQRYTQSQTFIHEYVSEFGGSAGVEVGVPWAKLLVELQAKYGFEQGQVDSRTADTTLEVEPGTNQVFIIVWSEVWDAGTATIMAGKDRIEAPFRVKKDVIYSIDSQKLACP